MPWAARLEVTCLTWPLLVRYGYLRPQRSGASPAYAGHHLPAPAGR